MSTTHTNPLDTCPTGNAALDLARANMSGYGSERNEGLLVKFSARLINPDGPGAKALGAAYRCGVVAADEGSPALRR